MIVIRKKPEEGGVNPAPPTTIDEAAAACRAAFAAHPKARLAWCCHHGIRMESLTEPAENRIGFILRCKPEDEKVVRLNNFRPVVSPLQKAVLKAEVSHRKALEKYRKESRLGKVREANWAWASRLVCCMALLRVLESPGADAAHLADVPHHTWDGGGIF